MASALGEGRRRSHPARACATESLTLARARRVAIAAQGLDRGRPPLVGAAAILRAAERLALFQIDSVNVVARAHYLPAFSRLGDYDMALLDQAAWGPKRSRRLFEYWAHEASLLPLDLHPLLRWRMAAADRGAVGWGALRAYAGERRDEAMALLDRIGRDGPLAASDAPGETMRELEAELDVLARWLGVSR